MTDYSAQRVTDVLNVVTLFPENGVVWKNHSLCHSKLVEKDPELLQTSITTVIIKYVISLFFILARFLSSVIVGVVLAQVVGRWTCNLMAQVQFPLTGAVSMALSFLSP